MGIGVSVFLLAVGAILAFAVHAHVAGIDIHVIGWILMAAGVIGLLLNLLLFAPRRRRTVVETHATAAPVATPDVVVAPPVVAQPVQPVVAQPPVVAQQPTVQQAGEYSARHEIRQDGL